MQPGRDLFESADRPHVLSLCDLAYGVTAIPTNLQIAARCSKGLYPLLRDCGAAKSETGKAWQLLNGFQTFISDGRIIKGQVLKSGERQ